MVEERKRKRDESAFVGERMLLICLLLARIRGTRARAISIPLFSLSLTPFLPYLFLSFSLTFCLSYSLTLFVSYSLPSFLSLFLRFSISAFFSTSFFLSLPFFLSFPLSLLPLFPIFLSLSFLHYLPAPLALKSSGYEIPKKPINPHALVSL